MENSFQTSFIPKKPIIADGASNLRGGDGKTINIPMVISIFILVVILIAAGGLFLYKNYLIKNKETLSVSLSKYRNYFDKNTISELEMYDKRTSAAKQVLASHIVLSPLFELINKLTLSTIQFTKFEHNTINNTFTVKMSGITRDYRSIALQADLFNKSEGNELKDIVFSNLTKDKDKNNYVTFDVEFTVDPSLLTYSNNVTNNTIESTTSSTNILNQTGNINSNQPLQVVNQNP